MATGSKHFGWVIGVCVAAVILIGVVSTVAFLQGQRVNDRQERANDRQDRTDRRFQQFIDQREVDRQQARYSTCVNDNVAAKRGRQSAIDQATELIDQSRRSGRDVTDEIARRYIDGQAKKAEATFPFRNCSPAGIDAYYANPPADPAVATPTQP